MLDQIEKNIIADNREVDVILTFMENGYKKLQVKQIKIADFIISSRTAVERKGPSYNKKLNRWQHDFVDSLMDGRFFKQANNMSNNYERVIYIIEGWNEFWEDKRITDEAKLTCMAQLATVHGAAIIPTKDKTGTMHVIIKLAEKDAEDGYNIPEAKKPRETSVYESQVFLLTSLLLVGRTKAIELLKIFETPFNVFKAIVNSEFKLNSRGTKKILESEFSTLKGFGKEFVRKNKNVLSTRCKIPKT